jgi:hypothetical protein
VYDQLSRLNVKFRIENENKRKKKEEHQGKKRLARTIGEKDS